MARRYIIRIAPSGPDWRPQDTAFSSRLSQATGMTIHRDRPGLTIATQNTPHLGCGTEGDIIGSIFRQGEQRAIDTLAPEEANRIIATRGGCLIEAYWGPYLAILERADRGVDIIRAPWGDLPCYRFMQGGATYLASDVALLRSFVGYEPQLDWRQVLAQLAHGPLHHATTCLLGIEKLPAGERWSICASGEEREVLWSPWTFAARDRQIIDRHQAADLVHREAQTCVGARASLFDQILLTLSGGLDSSIVAAGLAAHTGTFSAINLITRDAIGDERHYARRVSEALDFPLAERMRDVGRIDLTRSGAAGRPYPCEHAFFSESLRLAGETAQDTGAQAFFNGAGGDNIFCSLQSGGPAADRLLAEGFGRGFMRSVSDISQLAPASIPTVLRDAIARAWLGRPPFRHRADLALLSEAACGMIEALPDHPWVEAPAEIPPGKALHVWMLAHFRSFVESLDAQSAIPMVSPLLSQPLVEVCLRVPSWLWFEGGQNRVVAREAFSGLLPPDILARRSKGTPGSFNFEIFEAHRETIKTMLTEGQLARQGLIDLPGVLSIIDTARPPSYESVSRLLGFVDVEAWAASWSESAR